MEQIIDAKEVIDRGVFFMYKIIINNRLIEYHKPFYDHPESPKRIRYCLEGLRNHGLLDFVEKASGQDIDLDLAKEIAKRIHCRGYINYLEKCRRIAPCEIDPDTYFSVDTYEAVYTALFMSYWYARERDNVFLLVRPPGHHVGRCGKAMGAPTQGFCILNNAAAAVHGFKGRGFRRIVVLDIDLHHGNGTQEIFYRDPSVLHIDLHRDPSDFYPFTGFPDQIGDGGGKGYSVNLVLAPGTGDDSYIEVFRLAVNLITEFQPEALVVSVGLDPYRDDGLGDLMLTEYTFYNIGYMIRSLKLTTILVLEGGYSLGLSNGLPALVEGLNNIRRNYIEKATSTPPYVRKWNMRKAKETISLAKKYWR